MDSELIVARIVGGKEKPVLSLEVTDIQSIGPVEKKSALRTQRFALRTRKLAAVQIVYQKDGQDRRVILQPSEHMLRLIRARAFPPPESAEE